MVGVWAKFGIGEVNQIGIIIAGGPILDVIGPRLPAGGGLGLAMIIDEVTVVVVGVKEPGKRELFDVIGALRGFGASFGLAQNGQKQAGKDCNDGDYDEEFDQRESAPHAGTITETYLAARESPRKGVYT